MTGIPLARVETWLQEAGLLRGAPQRFGTPVADSVHLGCVDSRLAVPGSLFVALPGERTDGHRFVDDAVSRGAVAAFVHEDRLPQVRNTLFGSAIVYPVSDTLAALHRTALRWREQFPDLVRIGITGSNGKTTTKDMLASILAQVAPTVFTHGNYNSDIGLPIELLRIREQHRYGVFEMGMNRVGEIAELAGLVEPDLALITNVGSAHIGMVGSRRHIAEEKKSIFSRFDGDQTAVVPSSGEFSRLLSKDVNGRVLRHGRSGAGLREVGPSEPEGTTLVLTEGALRLPLPGAHMVANAIAAITVARALEIGFPAIRAGLEAVRSSFGRAQVLRGRVTVIQDCYNANPESVGAALRLLVEMPADGKRVAILGAMKELGENAPAMHRAVAEQALAGAADEVWFVGDEFREVSLPEDAHARWFGDEEWRDVERAVNAVQDGDVVLLKGSRALELERLTPRLLETRAVHG